MSNAPSAFHRAESTYSFHNYLLSKVIINMLPFAQLTEGEMCMNSVCHTESAAHRPPHTHPHSHTVTHTHTNAANAPKVLQFSRKRDRGCAGEKGDGGQSHLDSNKRHFGACQSFGRC